ncbi:MULTISPECIES: SDR family NAD(P)-dependent oxidoreductase [Rhodomicrobium]|uniref:SDR family NAD(P)-dependent oxidoreductase n=1 Tax=Rhodomicrobium TaxID=1068 RepID=UPI000B4A78E7|nr:MULTISPECIES: SDR family NAD(P)-dependent oxidoreductase [Rhodomicrobium]
MNDIPEHKRIALVTGASRGIGRAAAVALGKAGCHVILSARTSGGLEEVDDEIRAAGGSASIMKLNLSHGDKVDALGPTLYARWQRLDVLVAAGGMLGRLSPLGHIPTEDWEEVLRINLTANWRLIRAVDPLLRRSDAGRAIFFTSRATWKIRAYWGPYAVSKAGLEALVKTYAAEVATTPVKVNLIDPGPTRTAMRAQAYPGEDKATVKPPEALAPLILRLASPDCTESGEIIAADA